VSSTKGSLETRLAKTPCQNALLKRLIKVSSIESGLETCPAKITYQSVFYKRWPRNLPYQNALLKRLAKVSSTKSGLETRLAKITYQNALLKRLTKITC